jgi:phenylalanyl-tRNA synthetase beta chain
LPEASAVSRFPSVRRDLALLVPESVSWREIEQCIRATLGARLQSVTVFDQYHGSGLQPGTKSLAMGLILHDISRTLNDLEVEQSVSDVLEKLGTDCQAVLRG